MTDEEMTKVFKRVIKVLDENPQIQYHFLREVGDSYLFDTDDNQYLFCIHGAFREHSCSIQSKSCGGILHFFYRPFVGILSEEGAKLACEIEDKIQKLFDAQQDKRNETFLSKFI